MDAEDTLLSLIGHMLRQNLINIIELFNCDRRGKFSSLFRTK